MIEWVVSSCMLILLIIAIRQLFRKRLDLRVRYALWLIVAVRLLVPFSFAESRFSVLNLLDMDGIFGTERTEAEGDAGAVPVAVAESAILWGENKVDPEALSGVKGDVSAAVFGENVDDWAAFHGEDGNAQEAFYGEQGTLYGERGSNQGTLYGEKGSNQGAFPGVNGGVLAEFPGNYNDVLTGDGESGGRAADSEELSQGKRLRGELLQREQPQGQQSLEQQFWGGLFRSGTGKMVSMGSAAGRFLLIIWLTGSLLCGTVIFIVNLRDSRKRQRSRVPFIRRESRLPVYVSKTVQTPCMAGIFRPAIYLTEEALEEESRLPYIIAHENMHYRHKDHLWAVVRMICLCVHWFNPLVWIAVRLARQDGELACDADVLKHFGREERVEYGKALLELSIQRSTALVAVNLATTMSGGKRQLRERLEMIRKRPGTTAGVLAVVAVLVTVVLAVTFTGRRKSDEFTEPSGEDNRISANADQADGMGLAAVSLRDESEGNASLLKTALFDSSLPDGLLLKTDSDAYIGENGQESEVQPGVGAVFGYNNYTGYLDECVQWLDYERFTDCDYDGDGIRDRVWRENIQYWGVADYRIEFGNGDVIELPRTAGGIPEVRSLDLEGDGVRELLFTETFDYSTDPKGSGQMALLRKAGENYEMMELPAGISRVDSEEQAHDGNMVRYQPSLPLWYQAEGEYRMRVTCPALENMEGLEPLDVVVDFTQESWEMGCYDELYYSTADPKTPYQVDILPMENGRDALRLYFGVLDKWCNDDVVMTLEWEEEELRIRDIRYWHDYIETAYAEIGGQQYELILRGAGYVGGDRYTIDSILVDYIHYDERFNGMVEDNVQLIDPAEAAKQYWGEGYASRGGIMAKAFSSSRNGNILVADLNFDGNEDFCIQGWISEGSDIPYYCYFWNESAGQFEYGGCLTNVEPDKSLKCIRSTIYEGDGVYGVRYYGYEDGQLILKRYVKDDASSDAVFDHLDLTYVETGYSMDKADYLKDMSRLFRLAEKALTELYQMTGTKMEETCFTITNYGDVCFALTERELKASLSYYDRCYGAQEGFEDCIEHICIADRQAEFGTKTLPVEFLVSPPDQDSMTDEEIVQWYFENSPLAQINRRQLGNITLKSGDTVASIEETFEANYVIRTKSGKYYELTYNEDTKSVNTFYGPYDSFPVH